MFFFFLSLSSFASPRQDMVHVAEQTSTCNRSLGRLSTDPAYLYSVQKNGDPKEILLATTILKHLQKSSSLHSVYTVLQAERRKTANDIPTSLAVYSCQLLNAYPERTIAKKVAQEIHGSFWLNPCLPLLVHFAPKEPLIWSVLIQESTLFPNTNDIHKLLSRKGSVFTPVLFDQFLIAKTAAEVDLLSNVIWGLLPPVISPQLKMALKKAQEFGPLRTGNVEQQRTLHTAFRRATDHLSQRFLANKDTRIDTNPYQEQLGAALYGALCR